MANSSSGIAVNESEVPLCLLLRELEPTFIIDENIQQVTDSQWRGVGQPDESYDNFAACLPPKDCRYAVFDFDFDTDENCQKSKIIILAW